MTDTPPPTGSAPEPARPARVRVTAPRTGEPLSATPWVSEPADADSVIVASLIRSQLRLAILCALGFIATLAGIAAVAALPALDELRVAGVPVSWLVLAFAAYPPLVAIAGIAMVAANRTEAQFHVLAHRSRSDGVAR